MRGFLAGTFFIVGLITCFYAFYATSQDGFGASMPSWILGVGSAAIGIQLSQKKAQPDDPTLGEDMVAKENSRKVAEQLAQAGGMIGIMARQWLNAYEKDASVPIFGVRPYWTPTGPGTPTDTLDDWPAGSQRSARIRTSGGPERRAPCNHRGRSEPSRARGRTNTHAIAPK